jgi:hypothetical protein
MHPLKKYLLDTGQTQAQFAAKIPTSTIYLNHIITGRKKPGDGLVEAMVRESGGQLAYRDFRPDKVEQFDRIRELENGNP